MSAFVVDKAHITALIDAAMASHYKPFGWYHGERADHPGWPQRHELIGRQDEVGQMLLDQCVESVGCRYKDSTHTNLPGPGNAEWMVPYVWRRPFNSPRRMPTPVEALKAIHCYVYQSCEDPEWEKSESYAFCLALEHDLAQRLPGYDDAPWDWTESQASVA